MLVAIFFAFFRRPNKLKITLGFFLLRVVDDGNGIFHISTFFLSKSL